MRSPSACRHLNSMPFTAGSVMLVSGFMVHEVFLLKLGTVHPQWLLALPRGSSTTSPQRRQVLHRPRRLRGSSNLSSFFVYRATSCLGGCYLRIPLASPIPLNSSTHCSLSISVIMTPVYLSYVATCRPAHTFHMFALSWPYPL